MRKRIKPRRRGESLEDALLKAAKDELEEVGYNRLSIKGVAERAHTSRSVLSRRWSSRVEMALSVLRIEGSLLTETPPDSGSFTDDTLIILRRFVDRFNKIGIDIALGVLNDCLSGAAPSFDLAKSMHETSLIQMETIYERAVTRNEVRAGVPEYILALPIDLTRSALIFGGGSVSEDYLIKIVNNIFVPLIKK